MPWPSCVLSPTPTAVGQLRTLAYLLAEQGNIEELRARANAVEYERRGQYLEDIHLTRYDPARPGQWPALRFLP